MDSHKLARTTDPESSHMAAREHVESGRNESQKDIVLMWLSRMHISLIPELRKRGVTSMELAWFSELDRYMVARRLADLKAEGKVIQSPREEMRRCLVSCRLAVTWRLA